LIDSESFNDFKNSFSYGSRTDLNFKFLKVLSDKEAAQFFQSLLWKIGDFLNDGNKTPLIEHVRDWQTKAYSSQEPTWVYEDGPFTALAKPLRQAHLALITSTGHFVAGDDPQPFGVEDMTQEEAIKRISEFTGSASQLSLIPLDTPGEQLRVRHGGYDIRGAQADHNTVLPIDRLRELVDEGVIGTLQPTAYSFVGATAQTRLIKQSGPQWLAMFQERGIEAALLVPV
jgi:hypothetical protein